MRTMALVAAGAAVMLLTGCASPERDRFLVLDEGDGAVLCVEGVMESYPPQCADSSPRIEDWSWDGLAHEEAQGARWGEFRIAGERHGDTFVLSEPAEALPPGAP